MDTDLSSAVSDAVSRLPPGFDGEVRFTYHIGTVTEVDLPFLIVGIVLLLIAMRRSHGGPVAFLLTGLALLASSVGVRIAEGCWETHGDVLFYPSRWLAVLGWAMIAWYCLRLARSTGAKIRQPRSPFSADQSGRTRA